MKNFNKYIEKTDSCWLWVGSIANSGYGQISYNGRNEFAHRVSYLIHTGEIPDGMLVCHTCDNPLCVNPDHLFLGSHSDNFKDMQSKGRGTDGSKHYKAKLNEDDIVSILQLLKDHEYGYISEIYNVSIQTIANIDRGISWKHVPRTNS